MSQSYREAQKIQDKLSDVSRTLIPSKIKTFKKTLTRAKSMVDLLPLFKKEKESKMYETSSVPRSHSEPILIPSQLTPSISTELFSACVKDIEELESRLRPKVSKTYAREEKLSALSNAPSIRNENLKNLLHTHSVLILTRHYSESIKLGDDITVAVLGSYGNPVRLGISVPKEIDVYCEEIYRKIQEVLRNKEREDGEIPKVDETDIPY